MKKECVVIACRDIALSKGLCSMHSQRLRRNVSMNKKKQAGGRSIGRPKKEEFQGWDEFLKDWREKGVPKLVEMINS